MKIGIVGGGFTGLTAAYELAKAGHKVTVFEKDKALGGLAHGFRRPGWDWHLEAAYHHLFTNDHAIIDLIKELDLADKLIIKRPITANLVSPRYKKDSYIRTDSLFDDVAPFDSPLHLLTYPGLSLIDKLRTAILLTSIKINPFWQPFEWLTAKQLFLSIGGRAAWEAIWEPLMTAKFGHFAETVAASWLWARIKKRTPKLCYIEGGFHTLVTALEQAIKKHGGIIHTGIQLDKLDKLVKFDRTLLTIPTPSSIPHLHAQTLILETKEPILKNVYPAPGGSRCGVYWLNITDRSFPFLAVVAHTNMIDKKHYGGHHLTYFGNYLPSGHPYLSMTAAQLYNEFLPFIKRLFITANGKMKTANFSQKRLPFTVYRLHSFTGLFAQPVHERHYSRRAPKLQTLIKDVYLANMDSIYPWDRGTNYAVELGQKAARVIDASG